MPLTYFTEEEFRAVTRDEDSPSRFNTDDIEHAHDESVSRLEKWARTSWLTNVATRQKWINRARLVLDQVPVIEVTEFTLDGSAVDAADYTLDLQTGELRWGSDWRYGAPWLVGTAVAVIEWTYGFDYDVAGSDETYANPIPWEIKRPLIMACKTLLVPLKRDANIPVNARNLVTGRTSFDLRNPRSQTRPWPWDEGMSAQVRAVYEPFRFRQYVS